MSQWIEEFNNHAFHDSWSDLKIELEKVELDESSNSEDKENLARLNKVVNFVNDILENIDPELFPKDLLDNLNSYADSIDGQLTNYNSNQTITHLNNANQYVDNILKEIKPYIFYGDKLKKSLKVAISSYIGEIDKHLENIANTQSEYDKAKEYREEIEEYHNTLLEDDEEESIKTKIATMLETAESQSESLDGIYTNILVDDDEESTKTIIEEAKKDILRDAKEANEKLVEVSNKIDELDKFYTKIFGEYDEAKEARVGGLNHTVHQLHANLELFKNKQEDSYAELISEKTSSLEAYEEEQTRRHENLYNKIESLLPGATSAGMAKAYQEVKESFTVPTRVWNGIFIVALVGMFIGAYKTLEASQTLEETFRHLLQYAPLYIPAVWLAIFASKRRSENQRLIQEYAHKEALAKSYTSYKKQIDELEEEDQKLLVKLLDSAIDTISSNPSKTLDKKHDHEMPVKELVQSLLGELKGKK